MSARDFLALTATAAAVTLLVGGLAVLAAAALGGPGRAPRSRALRIEELFPVSLQPSNN